MNPNNAAAAAPPPDIVEPAVIAPASNAVRIETRFGLMAFQRDGAITLPRGIFGYADHHDYGLANLPDGRLEAFKLLQSLTEPALSFIVAPLNMDGETIEAADIDEAARALSIARHDVAVLLIVATRKMGAETQVSVNLRAPIILDTRNRTGWQYVLSNSRYSVRHVLSQGVRADAAGTVK